MTKTPTLPAGTEIDWLRIRQEWSVLIDGYVKRWKERPRVRPVLSHDGGPTDLLTATPYLINTNDMWHAGIIRAGCYRADYDNDATVWYCRADNLFDFAYRRVVLDPDRDEQRLIPVVWPRPNHVLTTTRQMTLDSDPVLVSPARKLRKRKLML